MHRDPSTKNNVITRQNVRVVTQPAMLDCGTVTDGKPGQPMAIVPMLDGDRIAGFEVRCGCGAAAIVECVYESTEHESTKQPPAPADQPTATIPPVEELPS